MGKKNHYSTYFTENSLNLRKIWGGGGGGGGIKELVNIKHKNIESINSIRFKGKNVTYFSTIAEELSSNKTFYEYKPYSDYLSNSLPNSFMFTSCDKVEIELLISELKINKCSGPNGIPTRILHMIKTC